MFNYLGKYSKSLKAVYRWCHCASPCHGQVDQIKSVDSVVSIHCFSSGASLTYFQSSTSYYKLPSSHRAANGGNGNTESLCFDLHL